MVNLLKVEKNLKGRDFIVGDLHGCYSLLDKALDEKSFNPFTDRLFSVGDLIDRGPASFKCLKLIENDCFYNVLGNHEVMMLDTLIRDCPSYDWVRNGGDWYYKLSKRSQNKVIELCIELHKAPLAITLETHLGTIGICHAQPVTENWDDINTLNSYGKENIIWGRSYISSKNSIPTNGVDITVHGHTPVKTPLKCCNAVFIDTGAVYKKKKGYLSLFSIEEIFSII